MKTIRFIFLPVLLFCTIHTVSAETISGTDDNIVWTLDMESGTLTIEGKGAMKNYRVSGVGVKSSAPWIVDSIRTLLRSVVVKNGITSISDNAFIYCEKIVSVILPDGITSIGSYAFYECKLLSEINIPEGITSIGMDAFFSCSSLTEVIFPESLTFIGMEAFQSSGLAGNLKLPSKLTEINWMCFGDCSQLTSVVIPEGVTTINEFAFYQCKGLKSLEIPRSVSRIEDFAFNGCNILENVTNKATQPQQITENTFSHYGTLHVMPGYKRKYEDTQYWQSFTIVEDTALAIISGIDGNITWSLIWTTGELTISGKGPMNDYSIFNTPWYHYYIHTVVINEGVTTVGAHAFMQTGGLESVSFPSSIEYIGKSAFQECWVLQEVSLKKTKTKDIAAGAFRGSGVISVLLPETLESIRDYSFGFCRYLADLDLPQSATFIGNYTFQWCSTLTIKEIPTKVTSIGTAAFQGSGLTSITIPPMVSKISQNLFKDCSSLKSVTLHEDVKTISSGAFEGCYNLTSISFPSELTDIGTRAFLGSGLTSIDIPEEMRMINDSSFSGSRLESVNIPSNIWHIGKGAFLGCGNLKTVELSEGVWSIGPQAFYDCNLSSVVIPRTTAYIYDHAFDRKTSKPIKIYNWRREPQSIDGYTFRNRYTQETIIDTLYVATGCKQLYEAADYWNQFVIIEDATDVPFHPINDKEHRFTFDLSGRPLDEMQKGIHIRNGKKVMVK